VTPAFPRLGLPAMPGKQNGRAFFIHPATQYIQYPNLIV
jgi:hypothetical protein